ncbi:cell wall hydrolase [Paraburkholderia nemoris]|uniref:cell wall hydrolase n=1 Tax=Paraburkholderia nemoris TaxID=2793076 RepID=UPI0038B7A356
MVVLASALLCLAANVFFESRGEPIPGQYAVALVTMNRAGHDPRKVCQEVTKPKQFSWTTLYLQRRRGSFSVKQEYVMKDEDSWDRATKIARVVLSGRFPDITNGATYYHATYVHPGWRKEVVYREKIGNHLFYASK